MHQGGTGSTTDEIVNAAGCGLFQHFIFLWVSLNWLGIGCAFNVAAFVAWGAKCELVLSLTQESWILNITYVGSILGSFFWGIVADEVGRKPVGVAHMLMALVGGFGAALLHSGFWPMLVCRFIVGFSIPGNLMSMPLLLEFSPVKWRGLGPALASFAWVFSALYVTGAGWLVLDRGFRYLVLLTLLPLVMALMQSCYIPETPHQLLVRGRRYGAEAVLEKLSKYNGRGLIVPSNWSLTPVTPKARGRGKLRSAWKGISALFCPTLRKVTFLIWTIWLVQSMVYGALVILTNDVFPTHEPDCHQDRVDMSDYKYTRMAIITSAEVVGIGLSLLMIESVGRKWPILGGFVLNAIGLLPMIIPMPIHRYSAPLFIARTGWAATFVLTMVYTSEFYPTEIRGIGTGTASGISAVGWVISRQLAKILVDEWSRQGVAAILTVIALAGAIATIWLPKDAKGRELEDVIPSDEPTTPLLEPPPENGA
ncbi:hypothetical protein BSKO_04153 [Bryopsis sp. KO-2023]|nr:hypothetical protein BSKO_04153 [Bryopsis sp. KO-2023]